MNKGPKQVLYPPVVAAHISKNLGDFVKPHIKNKNFAEIYLSSQPNSRPHLGTLTTISSAFALAYHLKNEFKLDSKIIFEVLDNAPAMKKEINGFTYFKPMCFVIEKGKSLADQNLESFKHFIEGIKKRSNIPYTIKKYSEMQKSPEYRKKLLEILDNDSNLKWLLNPTEGNIKMRHLCSSCFYGEKSGKSNNFVREKYALKLQGICPDHGKYENNISSDGKNFIDLNTPVRSLIRKALMIDKSKEDNSLKIMVDGTDWIGMSQQLLPCLGILNYSIEELPLRFFSPLIEDWSGSKFSKSAYVEKDTYNMLPSELCDYGKFKESLGEEGLDLIWDETLEWILDSQKFFRNYSIEYFTQKWNLNSRN